MQDKCELARDMWTHLRRSKRERNENENGKLKIIAFRIEISHPQMNGNG